MKLLRVVRIESTGKTARMYDIETKNRNFIADGVVTHNSLSWNARDAMRSENKEMGALMNIRRHQDLTIIFASQHHGFMDINAMRGAHCFFFKRLSWEESAKKHDSTAFDMLMRFIMRMMPMNPSQTLFTDGFRWMGFETDLPTFWSDDISKSYRKWGIEQAVTYIRRASDDGVKVPQIERQLAIRGFRKITRAEIRRAIDDPDGMVSDWIAAGYE